MKPDRDKVWKMFGKHCAYCGCELLTSTGKHMQVDHVKSIRRNWWKNDCLFPDNDIENNLFPSCPRCNNYKHSMSVEVFRSELKQALIRLDKVASYRNAVRFGMIEEKQWDGLFYFERLSV